MVPRLMFSSELGTTMSSWAPAECGSAPASAEPARSLSVKRRFARYIVSPPVVRQNAHCLCIRFSTALNNRAAPPGERQRAPGSAASELVNRELLFFVTHVEPEH